MTAIPEEADMTRTSPYHVSAADVREAIAAAGTDYGARSDALRRLEFRILQGVTQLGDVCGEALAEIDRQQQALDAENDAFTAFLKDLQA